MDNHRYDVVFLNFSVPLETRYSTMGELVNLVFNLNRIGVKSGICIIPPINFDSDKFSKSRNNLSLNIWNSLSMHKITASLVRRLLLKNSNEDLKNINILKVKNFDDLTKIDTRYMASWLWESAYVLNKIKLPDKVKKLQILHYGWIPEFLTDYFPEKHLTMFKEMYFSNMTKIAISKEQFNDFKDVKVYHWLQGINLKIFFNKKNGINQTLQILIPLRRPREKGAIYAIKAAEIIHHHNSNVKIISYGDYTGNIPDFMEHRGRVDMNDLIQLYRNSDIFILPSIQEGFSFPGLEAMASGCVVVSTKNGGSEQYIIDGVNGFLVENCNGEAIAEKVLELLNNKEYLNTIIKNAQVSVLEFSYEKAADRFKNILEEIDNSQQ